MNSNITENKLDKTTKIEIGGLTRKQIASLIGVLGLSLFLQFLTSPRSIDESQAKQLKDILNKQSSAEVTEGDFPVETLTARLQIQGTLEP